MDRPHMVAVATVVLILGVVLASGPLVGVSLTTEAEQFKPGSGTLEATVHSTPNTATLDAAQYSVEGYHLRAAPVEMRIDSVTGQPTVAYELFIHELNYTRSSVTFLDSSFTGTYQLEFEPTTLEADRIDQEEYRGTISIVVLNGKDARKVAKTEIRIEVQE